MKTPKRDGEHLGLLHMGVPRGLTPAIYFKLNVLSLRTPRQYTYHSITTEASVSMQFTDLQTETYLYSDTTIRTLAMTD